MDKTAPNNYYGIASCIISLVTETEKYGLVVTKVSVNKRTLNALSSNPEYHFLGWEVIRCLSTKGSFPPFYVLTGNGVSRHVEFIGSIEDYNRHVDDMKLRYNDEVEVIIEVRKNIKKATQQINKDL